MSIVLDGTTGISAPALTGPIDAANLTGSLPAIDGSALTGINVSGGAGGNPIGSIIYVTKPTPPTGFLKANGALVSTTTYAELFAEIGYTFGGGDGGASFSLPDLRGQFLRGWDDGRNADPGRAFGSAQDDAFQGHQHQSRTGQYDYSGYGGQYPNSPYAYSTATNVVLNPSTDNVNGAPRTANETRPRNVALLACIKY